MKRELEIYNAETDTWDTQPTKYYIRSSVMNGHVMSEVLSNGKKYRTYIKGVGNETAVQQAYATETATLDELVMFEFSDASGMSYRTTDKGRGVRPVKLTILIDGFSISAKWQGNRD